MAAGYLFELIHCGGFVHSGTGSIWRTFCSDVWKRKGQVRGPYWKIEWNGEDGTLRAGYCKWHRLWTWQSILCFPLFLHSEKEHSVWPFGAQTLTLQWCIKKPFYLSCGWTSTCCECYWLGQEKKWPRVMVLIFFPLLFLGNHQLIHPSDLTLGGCSALDAAGHILKFQTELQGCGSTVTVCGFLPPIESIIHSCRV